VSGDINSVVQMIDVALMTSRLNLILVGGGAFLPLLGALPPIGTEGLLTWVLASTSFGGGMGGLGLGGKGLFGGSKLGGVQFDTASLEPLTLLLLDAH